MEIGDPNLLMISFVLGVVLSLTVPTQPQTSADEFPMQVGMYIEQYIICAFRSQDVVGKYLHLNGRSI